MAAILVKPTDSPCISLGAIDFHIEYKIWVRKFIQVNMALRFEVVFFNLNF